MEPRDKDGRRKLKECESALRKQRFEEAIMTPEAELVSFHQPTPTVFWTRFSTFSMRLGDDDNLVD